MPKQCTIFTTESFAIEVALEIMNDINKDIVILSRLEFNITGFN